MVSDRDLFLAYGALMSGAVLPIYHGAFASLQTPLSTRKALKKAKKSDDDGAEEDSLTLPETLTAEDAYWLPIVGSVVLFSMFLVFKYLDKVWVDRVLGLYFGFVGTFAVTKVLVLLAKGVGLLGLFPASRWLLTKTIPASQSKTGKAQTTDILALRFTNLHPPIVLTSFVIVVAYLFSRHWIASNVIALSLSLSSISMLSLDSFFTGGIMLMGLFFYDIFWVFGTNVMVSVARGFDGPIKIVWPKNLFAGLIDGNTRWQMTMLGLGDIVVPGIFVALALRFDQHLYVKQHPKTLITKNDVHFAKPYFTATMIGYVAGLTTTMGVMHFTGAAQPALLYLSPACILAVALRAAQRGELEDVWNWKEETSDEGKSKTNTKKKSSSSLKAVAAANNGDSKTNDETAEDDENAWEGMEGDDGGVASSVKRGSSSRRRKKTTSD